MYFIYQLKSPNSKVYFGYTQNIDKRFNYGCGFHANKALSAAIEHYGWSAFEKTILEQVDDELVAKQIVDALIINNHADNPAWGYNRQPNHPSSEAQIVARGLRKRVQKLDPVSNQVLVEYKSIAAAAASINGSPTSLCNCLQGRLKTYKGYRWAYAPTSDPSSTACPVSQG